VILQSGAKQRTTPQAFRQIAVNSKVYPLTDVDENNASVANVGPGGLTSADENSIEGSRR